MRRLFILLILICAIFPLRSVILGGFPFWFDPARDLLLALGNIKKITLIGSPTGIPGLFYGPYWIWLLSLPLHFSRDPRWVIMAVLTIPYLTIFPLVLWQFRKIFGELTIISLWLLFILAFNKYASSLWNPHLAPLLFLVLAYLVLLFDPKTLTKKTVFSSYCLGLVSGLILSFHFSFGLATILSTSIWLALTTFSKNKTYQTLFQVLVFGSGVAFSLLPFFFFEARHGFHQTASLYYAFSNSMFYNSAVVGQVGLSKLAIIWTFQKTLASLLQISPWLGLAGEIPLLIFLGYQVPKKRLSLPTREKQLLIFLILTLTGIVYLFFSSKNPIWDYHFIGVETIFLLLLGLVAAKFKIFSRFLFLWSVILLFTSVLDLIRVPVPHYQNVQSFQSKKTIVEKIYRDAQGSNFAVYSYSAALYTFDYDYLFPWIAQDEKFMLPTTEIRQAKFVYLIIPQSPKDIIDDFVHYRTPDKNFVTVSQLKMPDDTLIIKRRPVGKSIP